MDFHSNKMEHNVNTFKGKFGLINFFISNRNESYSAVMLGNHTLASYLIKYVHTVEEPLESNKDREQKVY